jgi:hypothetical protein
MPEDSSPALTSRRVRTFVAALVLLLSGWGYLQGFAHAQQQAQPLAFPSASNTAQAVKPGAIKVAGSPPKAKVVTSPLWTELTPAQQQALTPLSAKWDTISEAQKRKWIALSQNYPKLSAPEQAKLHSRMSEWVALSPQQRTEARLNFGETQQLSPDDKKAKWEAYQALSPEEKRKLAASASKPPATAAAVKPVTPEKLANVPRAPSRQDARTPRITATPDQVNRNTLLPQQALVPAPAPAPAQAPAPATAPTD